MVSKFAVKSSKQCSMPAEKSRNTDKGLCSVIHVFDSYKA